MQGTAANDARCCSWVGRCHVIQSLMLLLFFFIMDREEEGGRRENRPRQCVRRRSGESGHFYRVLSPHGALA